MVVVLIISACVLGVVWYVVKHDDYDHPDDE